MILCNRAKYTYDALIMPSEIPTFTEIHLDLNVRYLPTGQKKVKILLTHLNTKDVLKSFTRTINTT